MRIRGQACAVSSSHRLCTELLEGVRAISPQQYVPSVQEKGIFNPQQQRDGEH